MDRSVFSHLRRLETIKWIVGLAGFGTVGLILFLMADGISGVNYMKKIHRIYFPVLEQNAISLRLEERIHNRIEIILTHAAPAPADLEELEADRRTLAWNLKEMSKLVAKGELVGIFAPDREKLHSLEDEVIQLISVGKFVEARKSFHKPLFVQTEAEYERILRQMSETLSAIREEEVRSKGERMRFSLITSTLLLIALVGLWITALIGYRENRRRRLTAEESLERQRATSLAQSKLAALGEMAGGVAHEINNPLTTITLLAEQTKDALSHGPPSIQHVNVCIERISKISATADRIAKIVRGLRSFARNSERDGLTPVSLAQIAQDTLELCRARFVNHGIQLETTELPPSLIVDCRPAEISQILLNLMNNAFDAVTDLPERWIKIGVETDNHDMVSLTVTDSGRGIPHAVAEKIMNPFFTTKAVGKGTGLGLSISVGLAKAHGGELFLDRNSNHTRFVLKLPFKRAESSDLKQAS